MLKEGNFTKLRPCPSVRRIFSVFQLEFLVLVVFSSIMTYGMVSFCVLGVWIDVYILSQTIRRVISSFYRVFYALWFSMCIFAAFHPFPLTFSFFRHLLCPRTNTSVEGKCVRRRMWTVIPALTMEDDDSW